MNSPEDRLAGALAENERLTASLERESAMAKAAREELQAFVYAVSHDVKQSLRTAGQYSQLLARQPDLPESAAGYLPFILNGVSAAITLIDQLNSFSRINMAPPRTMIRLDAICQMAMLKMARDIRDAGAQVTCRDLPEAAVNDAQFGTLFEHLIDNALKYRGSDPPRIEVSGEEGDSGHVVSVRDNGPGIEPKFLSQIFLPFKRLHGKEIPGTGLGLAVCKKIAEAHGGSIWAESDGRNGSVLRVLIPY